MSSGLFLPVIPAKPDSSDTFIFPLSFLTFPLFSKKFTSTLCLCQRLISSVTLFRPAVLCRLGLNGGLSGGKLRKLLGILSFRRFFVSGAGWLKLSRIMVLLCRRCRVSGREIWHSPHQDFPLQFSGE